MDDAQVPDDLDDVSPLLAAVSDLAKCHRDHVRYYASVPRERSATLRGHAASLLALADHEPTAVSMSSLPALRRSLWLIADVASENGAWLEAAVESSWEAAEALLPLDEFADVLEERHRIIANDWQAAMLDGLAGRLVQRAVEILASIDAASSTGLPPDVSSAAAATTTYRFRCAAALVNRAADLLGDVAALGAENEARWAVVQHWMLRAGAAERASVEPIG